MIYEPTGPDAPLSQGDIFDECPITYWTTHRDQTGALQVQSASSNERVIILT